MLSTVRENISGIPQGSILSPILFTLFVNDFIYSINLPESQIFIFADDIFLLFSHDKYFVDVLQANMDYNLNLALEWFQLNNLSVNVGKCKAMIFNGQLKDISVKMGSKTLNIVEDMKCLGIIIDNKLTFGKHINKLASKVSFVLKRLYNLGSYLPTSIRITVAHAVLMPHIIYGLEVIAGCSVRELEKLRKIFRRIIRYVFKLKPQVHITAYEYRLLGCNFFDYVKIRSLLLFYKIIKFKNPPYLNKLFSFSHSSRNTQIVIPRIYCATFEKSFVIRVGRLWNKFPISLKKFSSSLVKFKRLLLQRFSVSPRI